MRLTEKYEDFDIDDIDFKNHIIKHRVVDHSTDYEEKLGQLEDIEEELGIDLVTLIKALKNGIYVVDYKGQEPYKRSGLELDIKDKVLNYHWSFFDMNGYDSGTTKYYFKDYGKTWALTKEELEK